MAEDKWELYEKLEGGWLADAHDELRGAMLSRFIGNKLLWTSASCVLIGTVMQENSGYVIAAGFAVGGVALNKFADKEELSALQCELQANTYRDLLNQLPDEGEGNI